jgi:hypothetical protein
MRKVLPITVMVLAFALPLRAGIIQTAFVQAETLDLTAAGTIDWCVYRIDDADKSTYPAADWKKSGSGIFRKIRVRGSVKKNEATKFTGVGWGWTDGTRLGTHSRRQGDDDGMGIRAWIGADSAMIFEFAAPPAGKQHQAYLMLRCDGRIKITARQGERAKEIKCFSGGKNMGAAVARFDGDKPLTIELKNTDKKEQVVRGFAAALSGPVDFKEGLPRLPSRQDIAAKKAASLGKIDFLKAARDFADCMIKYGRDRYGDVHSPLFAVLLTREAEPKIGPQPYFARPSPYNTSKMSTPYRLHNYNKCSNYPSGLGGEGPHKVTFFGCDVYEDSDLYTMLIDLTRITGEKKFRDEAEKALHWWFTKTMGPAGLYPWGEHLGWDFENECPTYFEGPSKHLYAACYHEIKDRVPFLDFLAAIPSEKEGEPTYLEKYALGVWKAHYWDQEKAIYCRHGDYTGKDDRKGSYAGFPAHQGAHLRLWVKTYMTTKNEEIKAKMRDILNRVLDVQIARTKKYGFVPFTFDPDYKGKDPGKSVPGQSIRLARHAAELAKTIGDKQIGAKLDELARLHLVKSSDKNDLQKPPAEVANLSKADTPAPHGEAIIRLVGLYRTDKDREYLRAAQQQARLAYVRFMDDNSPLPKAYETLRKTADGKPFPDFYFRGAKMMHAFALLGEALRGEN